MNETTSLTEAADSLFVVHLANAVTSKGSVAFNGLGKRGESVSCNRNYNASPADVQGNSAAEAKDAAPVTSGEDFTVICAWCGFMSHLGRGPVSHDICKICRVDFFPEVPLA